MTHSKKKQIKAQQIKLGMTSKKRRSYIWQYILSHDLGIGYTDAQDIQRKGVQVLKPLPWFEDQPN